MTHAVAVQTRNGRPTRMVRAKLPAKPARAPMGARNLSHVGRDVAHRWRDQDPIVAALTRAITDSGLSVAQISIRTGLAQATIRNICDGTTRRPQFPTVRFIYEKALGMKLTLVPINSAEPGL